MERYGNIDKAPSPLEVRLPHRSDGIGYALRRAYPAAPVSGGNFSNLLSALNSIRINGRIG